jgi:hypothetical protein
MIALLPLRGWVGDAMATQMAVSAHVQQEIATESIAGHAHHSGAAAHLHGNSLSDVKHALNAGAVPDCHTQLLLASAKAVEDNPVQGHCDTCTSCQACFFVALVAQSATQQTNPAPHGVPHACGSIFTSAEPAQGFKPPIT